MKIFFRVDSSFKIGTGHLMRCLTLADELKTRAAAVEFICRDHEGNLSSVAVSKGYKVHLLQRSDIKNENYCAHAGWLEASWQDDAREAAAIAKGADWLIIDHYAIDERWENLQRGSIKKIAVIDDLADRKHSCDLLLDQNYYSNAGKRYNGLVPGECTMLLTPKYSMLRPEFATARKQLKTRTGKAQKILIFFGGVDADNSTLKALKALENFVGQVKIVAGGANRNLSELEIYCKNKPSLKLQATANNMAELMAQADIAIGSGGSTSWERACLGLPSFVWPIADNQVPILKDLNELGAVKITDPASLLDDINSADLLSISQKAFVLTDGKGAARVANYIAYELRKAEADDCERIWKLRNEKEIREKSLNKNIIPFEAHQKWYQATLLNAKKHILVLAADKVAAVLRFDVEADHAEVSIYVQPELFGMGLGENIMERGFAYFRNNVPGVTTLTARILDDNISSQALFKKFGFEKKQDVWVKKI